MSYEKLREECNRRLPERLELKFGCEVVRGGKTHTVYAYFDALKAVRCVDGTRGDGFSVSDIDEILGTPLTIADVLRVLSDRHGWNFCGVANELLVIETGDTKEAHEFIYFNLAAPLSDPSNAAACEAVLSIITEK